MTSKFECSIRQIPYPQQSVYNMLSDLNNIEKVKDKIPEDKVKELTFDANSISISSPMGAIELHITEREEPKCIKFETTKSPLPITLWIQLLSVTATSCKMRITIKTEVNIFLKGMIKKPMQQAIEKIADVLQMIRYE